MNQLKDQLAGLHIQPTIDVFILDVYEQEEIDEDDEFAYLDRKNQEKKYRDDPIVRLQKVHNSDYNAEEVYQQFTTKWDEDVDPGIHYAAAKAMYVDICNFKMNSYEDYAVVFGDKNKLTEYSTLLKAVNECHLFKNHPGGRVYFITNPLPTQLSYGLEHTFKLSEFLDAKNIKEETKQLFRDLDLVNYVNNNLRIEKPRFATFVSEPKDTYANIYEGLYQGCFQNENEKWESFRLFLGEFPKDFRLYKGFIISGSHLDSFDRSKLWYNPFKKMMKEALYSGSNGPKIFGICWGHQFLAHSFGGDSENMGKGLLVKRDLVVLREEFFEQDYVKKSPYFEELKKNDLHFIEFHGDHVKEIPIHGIHCGQSTDTHVEIEMISDRALSAQFHPEFNLAAIKLICQVLEPEKEKYMKGLLKSFEKEQSLGNKYFNDCVERFLKSK